MAKPEDTGKALGHYRHAVEIARTLLMSHKTTLQFSLAFPAMLNGLSRLLIKTGRPEEARRHVREGLDILRARVEPPTATAHELTEYAWLLLTCEPAEVRDPTTALRQAQRAVQLSNSQMFEALNTLALAYYVTGDRDRAMETARRVLASLPVAPESPDDAALSRALESGFAKYKPR
jgi:tetratricopeptide (TPR) repeat protein